MWDERYSSDDYVYGVLPNDFVKERAHGLVPGDALCLADGEGRNGVHLAELGHRVTSVDLSTVGLDKANRLAAQRGVELNTVLADLGDYELGESQWDLIVSVFAHIPPTARRALHRRIETALRPGGRFIVEAYTVNQLGNGTGGPPTAELMYSLDELLADLHGLTIEHGVEVERSVVEGAGHTGIGAVVQLVATRPAN